MKILIVSRGFSKKGGISRTSLEAALHLAGKGHDITVATNEVDSGGQAEGIRIARIRLLKLPFVSSRKLKNLIEVPQFVFLSTLYVLLNRKRYDIVWNKGNTQCLLQDVVTAESCHRAWIEDKKARGEKRYLLYPLHRFILWVEARNYRPGRSRAITCISNIVKGDILRSFPHLHPEDVKVIYNGVNPDDFSADERARESIRRKHSVPGDHFVLLFVGWEFDRKGLEYVIRALPLIKGKVRLLVVGDPPKQSYEKLAGRLGVSRLVEFCGGAASPGSYYSAADFFVFPTKMDAFGLVVLEAMCAGNVVVTSRFAGAAELVENGKSGFILEDHTSPEEIASIVDRVITDGRLRVSVRENAVRAARENGWDRVGDEYESLFEKITGESSSSSPRSSPARIRPRNR